MLPATAKGACGVLGECRPWFTSICAMIEMRRGLGGCCGRGGHNRRGSSFSLAAGRDKGPIEIRTLSLPAGRDKTGAPFVVFDTPPSQQPPTLHHISTPSMGIYEVKMGLPRVLQGIQNLPVMLPWDSTRFYGA